MVGMIRTIKPRFLSLFCSKIAALTCRHCENLASDSREDRFMTQGELT